MGMFIHDAGSVVWPVLLFGLLGLVAAARYARSPRRDLLALVAGLAITTLLLGALGTVVGVQLSARAAVDPSGSSAIFVEGVRESLNNLVVALLFGTLQALIATYGTFRLARIAPPGHAAERLAR